MTDHRKATISNPGGGQNYSLTLKDDDHGRTGKHTYKGQRTTSKKSYVLIFDPAKQTCTLEPLSAAYSFNLTSTPSEPSAAKLAQKHPQIQLQNGQSTLQDDGLFGEEDDAEDSPYDYRNFLQPKEGSLSPDVLTGSAVNTPVAQAAKRTPLSQTRKPPPHPVSKKPTSTKSASTKASSAAFPSSSRKVGGASISAPPKKSKPEPPTVVLERRASTRPIEKEVKQPSPEPSPVASEDEFIIENDEPAELPTRKPKSLGIALREHAAGPISLRSAANSASPSSRLHTPLHSRAQPEDDDVIDFGDAPAGEDDEDAYGDEEDEEDEYMHDDGDARGEADADVDGEADYDVEPMDIGPPAHESAQQRQAELPAEEEEDDADADFEAEMMEGLLEMDSESEEE